MPELPDVEVLRGYVDATALHKTIRSVHIPAPEMLASVSRQAVVARLHGRCFTRTGRHGKYLFLHTSGQWSLILHFGMTGTLKVAQSVDRMPSAIRMLIGFDDGYRLAYHCPRKFGAIGMTTAPRDFIARKGLGPDPLTDGLDREAFVDLMGGRRGTLKSALMNQRVMAGIGNVYADEILYHAGWHPRAAVGDLGERDLGGLFDAMQAVVSTAVGARARPDAMPPDTLIRRREPGRRCPRCDGRIRRTKVSGRSAYYCDRHQREP